MTICTLCHSEAEHQNNDWNECSVVDCPNRPTQSSDTVPNVWAPKPATPLAELFEQFGPMHG